VIGWETVPAAERPPVVSLIHLSFDVMVGLGSLLLLLGLWAAFEYWWHRRLPPQRVFWWAGAVSGVAAVLAMEAGWVVTEVGRQPWVVYRLQTTAEAATTNGGVVTSLSLMLVLYAILAVATIGILRALARRWRRGEGGEPVPYGPPPGGGPGTLESPPVVPEPAGGLSQMLAVNAVLGAATLGIVRTLARRRRRRGGE
jgi:cytochrome d ubiquinol oxidase subunit I